MATNPGSWSSPSTRQTWTPTLGSPGSGHLQSNAPTSLSSKHRISKPIGVQSTSEKEDQSISTLPASASSPSPPTSANHAHKFESAATGSPYPALPPGSTVTMGRDASLNRLPFSSPAAEQAPASLPARLPNSSGSSPRSPRNLVSTPNGSPSTSQLALSSSDAVTAQYSYDLSSSNIILPRGAIRPVTVQGAAVHSADRSTSPMQLHPQIPRPASLSAMDLASKSEKSRKLKKTNGSSLPAPPPSSSVASVPVAEGTVEMAEAITNRWPDALFQGWMKKRNKGKESTAKKRYLVIKTHCLEYYSDPAVRIFSVNLYRSPRPSLY